jgi:hypothetical protein
MLADAQGLGTILNDEFIATVVASSSVLGRGNVQPGQWRHRSIAETVTLNFSLR